MGIQNLMPFVKKACRQGNISEFADQSIAVDVSCLLHRGLFGCASDVAKGVDTDFYIRYVEKYVKSLTGIGCHVILVFDGQQLPAKKCTNDMRREKRDQQKRKGELLLSEGKESEAFDCFKRSTTITTEIVENTVQAFRERHMVDVLVAPYESDAQLAFLTKTGKVFAVVTEDSDLIAFGCERIIFKMEHTGSCLIYERENLPKCFSRPLSENFDFAKFRRICILAGCDYLQAGLPGIGLNKATTFFAKANGSDMHKVLPRLPRYLNMPALKIKKEFIADFIRAEQTFLHQIVFDPAERRQRPLNAYPQTTADTGTDTNSPADDDDDFVTMCDEQKTDFSFAGEIRSSTVALRHALGNGIGEPSLCDKFTLPSAIAKWSIWSDDFESGEVRRRRKEDVDRAARHSCGAFTLSSPVRKVRKVGDGEANASAESAREDLVTISDSPAKVDVEMANSQSSCDDDFVTPAKAKTVRNHTLKAFFSETSTKKTSFVASTATSLTPKPTGMPPNVRKPFKRGNGALRNWNSDELLRLYAKDADCRANSSPSVSENMPSAESENKESETSLESQSCIVQLVESSVEAIVAKEVSVEATTIEKSKAADHSADAVAASEAVPAPGHVSRYFLNRQGSKTSGLSRLNPFKKIKLNSVEEVTTSDDRSTSPTVAAVGTTNSAYRASGLRRGVSAKSSC